MFLHFGHSQVGLLIFFHLVEPNCHFLHLIFELWVHFLHLTCECLVHLLHLVCEHFIHIFCLACEDLTHYLQLKCESAVHLFNFRHYLEIEYFGLWLLSFIEEALVLFNFFFHKTIDIQYMETFWQFKGRNLSAYIKKSSILFFVAKEK